MYYFFRLWEYYKTYLMQVERRTVIIRVLSGENEKGKKGQGGWQSQGHTMEEQALEIYYTSSVVTVGNMRI